jgi:hypothetical protein
LAKGKDNKDGKRADDVNLCNIVRNRVVFMANDNAKDESDVPWSLLIAVIALCFVLIIALPIMGIMYMDMNNATVAAMEEVKKMRELRAKILMGVQE